MNKTFKFIKTSSSEKSLIISAFVILNTIRLGLLILPFSKLLKLIQAIDNFLPQKTQQVEIKQIIHGVHTSNYYTIGNSKCLAKALTTQTLMRAHGYSSELKIGVARKNDSTIQAHAWVEYRGKVIIGNLKNLGSFTLLTSI